MLDLRRLAVLHEFSVRGSIAATAQALGYSPSAISQQLTTLERETGAVLLERTARTAALTDAGRLLARHARILLREAEEAEAALSDQTGRVSGYLGISTLPSTAAAVARAVAAIQRANPDVEIVMRQAMSGQAAESVADRDIDLAVTDDWSTRNRRAPEGLTRRSVYRESVILAVGADHPLADRATGPPLTHRELAQAVPEMTWLCSPEGHPSRVAGDALLEELGVKPRVRWEFEGLGTLAELVAGGTGSALLPEGVARVERRSRLAILELSPAPSRQVHLLLRSSMRTSRTMRACVDGITEELQAQVERWRAQR